MMVCYEPYTKSPIGSISVVVMIPAAGDTRRDLFIADGQDFLSPRPGYQPKNIGTYLTPDKAEEAIRMHAYYAGQFSDPDLFERSEVSTAEVMKHVLDLLAHTVGTTPDLNAEDAKKPPEQPTRPLPPELAQLLADAPKEVVDTVMKANDQGIIGAVRVYEIGLDQDQP